MLKSIEYTAQFASTGRTLHEKIKFDTGFGAITGPNESGKSMVLEMVRWLLFGSAALRGSASDYVKLHGALEFGVRGVEYFITRASNGATLRRGKDREEIAVGTKPVNAKLVEILGFGLPVFDIACVANQNDLLALGEMTPANRKRLVDSVIGLGVIEDMGKLAGEEANALKRRYEDIMSNTREPIEPMEVPNYIPSEMLKPQLNDLNLKQSELDRVSGWLSVDKPKVKKPETAIPMTSDELQTLVETQNAVRTRASELAKMAKPRYTAGELDSMKVQNQGYENVKRLGGLKARALHLAKNLIECPSCGHEWSLDQFALDGINKEISDLELGAMFSKEPSELNDMAIDRELKKLKDYDENNAVELEQLNRTLDKQPDFRSMLMERQRYELDMERYDKDVQSYDEWRREFESKLVYRNELEMEVAQLPLIKDLYESAREYENHMGFYKTVKAEYDSVISMAKEVQIESEDWGKARVALATLRSKVKQHLVPSLNRVASHLLKEMTGGQRQSVVIDEEFNISVDGQPLNTLSGSGMAIANLAIRIGLGQVLTRNVFNVFMADEIDASMDKVRADSTAQSLQNLRSSISQILLVTHKSPVADYYIQLGESNDQPE